MRRNKRRIRLYMKMMILLLCFCIIVRIFTLVLGKYESEASGEANVGIAFYLLKEDYKTMTLNLDSLFPRNDAYVYNFSIGNEDGEKVSDIDLKYSLKIRTTTNLPLTYDLYMNQQYTDSDARSIINTESIEQDEDGTYFRIITTEDILLRYTNPTTNNYQLVVHFPENYNTENYQNIIDVIEIQVNSSQYVE